MTRPKMKPSRFHVEQQTVPADTVAKARYALNCLKISADASAYARIVAHAACNLETDVSHEDVYNAQEYAYVKARMARRAVRDLTGIGIPE